MKFSPAPHEKLEQSDIAGMLEVLQSNYEIMTDCMDAYKEVHERLMTRLHKHFFPERFHVGEVSIGEMSEMFSKAYPDVASGGIFKMTRSEVNDGA